MVVTDASARPHDPVSEPVSTTPRRVRRLRRLLIPLLIASPLVIGLGGWAYVERAVNLRLNRSVAEADRLDPGWRMADLETKRVELPDSENSALVVRSAIAKFFAVTRSRAVIEVGGPKAVTKSFVELASLLILQRQVVPA